jgi:phytol kinase
VRVYLVLQICSVVKLGLFQAVPTYQDPTVFISSAVALAVNLFYSPTHHPYMLELRRNMAHLLLGSFFAFLVVTLPREIVIACNVLLIGGLLVSSFLYQTYKIPLLTWIFTRFDRPGKFTAKGAIIFFVGTLIAILLFPQFFAALSILVLSVSDSLATIAGHYAGKHVLYKKKTIEGTSVFFASTLVILVLFVTPIKALVIALLVSATELFTPKYLDDNLTIPFVTGLLLSLLPPF